MKNDSRAILVYSGRDIHKAYTKMDSVFGSFEKSIKKEDICERAANLLPLNNQENNFILFPKILNKGLYDIIAIRTNPLIVGSKTTLILEYFDYGFLFSGRTRYTANFESGKFKSGESTSYILNAEPPFKNTEKRLDFIERCKVVINKKFSLHKLPEIVKGNIGDLLEAGK
jgi:hypothetical protein